MNKNKQNRGITLVALVITVIMLLILAGVTISSITNSDMFEKAKLAKERYENESKKEEDALKEYQDKIDGYITGSREETVTLSKEQYDSIISRIKSLEGKVESYKEPTGLTTAIADLYYDSGSTKVLAGTKTLADYKSNINISNEEYVKFNSTTSNIEIQQDGWYVIDVGGLAYYSTAGGYKGNLVINGIKKFIGLTYIDASDTRGDISQSTTVYLKKGDTVNFEIQTGGDTLYYSVWFYIRAN